MEKLDLKKIIDQTIKEKFEPILSEGKKDVVVYKTRAVPTTTTVAKQLLTEAYRMLPKNFLLKTERLSSKTKQVHEVIYKGFVEAFNKASAQMDATSKAAANGNFSAYENVSRDVVRNSNAARLHEMYFSNISDLASEISYDSIPYIKLARSFGSFEAWQYDFIATCMVSTGWAMTVYDTYHRSYCNVIVEGDDIGVPVGSIPVLVMDMHEHAYFKDYTSDKKAYVVGMMKELNWNVVEARMTVSEQAQLDNIWRITPTPNQAPGEMLSRAVDSAEPTPIDVQRNSTTPQQTLNQQPVPTTQTTNI